MTSRRVLAVANHLPAMALAAWVLSQAIADTSSERVNGRVIDISGKPIPLVTLRISSLKSNGEEHLQEVVSGEDGSFQCDGPGPLSIDTSSKATHMALFLPSVGIAKSHEPVVVAARRRSLSGLALDESGAPRGGIEVQIGYPVGVLSTVSSRLGSGIPRQYSSAVTNGSGEFSSMDVPDIAGSFLISASGEGFCSRVSVVESLPAEKLTVNLTRSPLITGIVTSDHLPIQGATVVVRGARARTDVNGVFEIGPGTITDGMKLLVFKEGHPYAIHTRQNGLWNGSPGLAIKVNLSGQMTTARGRIVSDDGRPLSGWTLCFATDGLIYCPQRQQMIHPEQLYLGFERGVVTNHEGEFAFPGVAGRQYAMIAFEPGAHRGLRLFVRAGEEPGATFTFQPHAFIPMHECELVDRVGRAVVGATVTVTVPRSCTPPKPVVGWSVTSDQRGRCAVSEVCNGISSLWVRGPGVLPTETVVAAVAGSTGQRIVVSRSRVIIVESAQPAVGVDTIRALGANDITRKVWHENGPGLIGPLPEAKPSGALPCRFLVDDDTTHIEVVLIGGAVQRFNVDGIDSGPLRFIVN